MDAIAGSVLVSEMLMRRLRGEMERDEVTKGGK